jgi:very-short-patch-repair endonuclease
MGACLMQPEQTIRRARRFRKTPTRAEAALWPLLRHRAVADLRFRRQVPIDRYVCDFACLSVRLIIEIDGGVHRLREGEDADRDAWLRSQGFTILRFTNSDVASRSHLILKAIRRHVGAQPPSEPLCGPPSPEMGEGVSV